LTSVQNAKETNLVKITFGLLAILCSICSFAIVCGVFTPIAAQIFSSPLQKATLRTAFQILKRRFWAFLITFVVYSLYQIIGLLLAVIPLLIITYWSSLSLTVAIMEPLQGRAALRRSKELVRRIPWAVTCLFLTTFLLIAISSLVDNLLISGNKSLEKFILNNLKFIDVLRFFILLCGIFTGPVIMSLQFLMYFKARQAGGETLSETLAEFEAENLPCTAWQAKMLARGGSRK
jgi:hypothetical protein